jgi:hypothetical protein
MMSLDEELAALLAGLGVELERPPEAPEDETRGEREPQVRYTYGARASARPTDSADSEEEEGVAAVAELSLFQTSREHYGVFYRLDLTVGVPHLRIYMPEDEGALKMRCYLVRAAKDTPLHEWFISARRHEGSQAYEDARDTAQQHLLFAAGELMKRLFWTGDLEAMEFPDEIAVLRVA